jgi:integrase
MWSYLVARCMRDAIMFLCGIYLGIRISDILKLCAGDVAGTHLRLKETKTRKTRAILIAPPLRQALAEYCKDLHADDLLFPSRQGYRRPIGRARAYEILRQAARACGLEHIGTHSLRKTFGRAVYQQTHSLTQLREIFGHRDESDTARYIGLQQDDFDAAIGKLRFIK